MGLSAGTTLGAYRIVGPLGAGGMGEVYRARDTKLNRDVAIKVLPDPVAQDRDRLARFEREAHLLASLNHPNIASIYGLEDSTGVPALVLELVEGPTLADMLAVSGPRLSIDEAIEIARQVAVGLEAAHDKGIIHRDLKPANVKRTPDGTVKILDFGLAKALDEASPAPNTSHSPTVTVAGTHGGVILGTAAYMSPERARGQLLDERTDVWGLGCILYELLTNRVAFAGPSASDILVNVLSKEPDWSELPAATPAAIRRLLKRCLEKDRRRRLHAIADARIEIEEDARGPADDRQTTPSSGAPQSPTWIPWAVAVLAAAAALALAVRGAVIRTDPTPSLLDVTPESITFDAGLAVTPAISPDGRLVAYASDRAGHGDLDIWVQQVAGGTPLQLTRDPFDEDAPDFSPDGSQIVFRSARDGGGIYVVSTLSGEPRLIARRGRRPRFSPDGSRVAYWVGDTRGVSAPGSKAATYVMFLAGGDPMPLLGDFAIAHDPVWSPDGRALLITAARVRENPLSLDWWFVPLDGREAVPTGAARLPAVKASFDGPPPGYDWRADVIFSDGTSLWSLPISADARVAGAPRRLTLGVDRIHDPSVSRANTIVFASSTVTRVIERVPLTGADDAAPRQLYMDNRPDDGRASQTADGAVLVFARDREIWIKDLRTGKERFVLSAGSRTSVNVTVSPDGARIAYGANGAAGVVDGYAVETAGGVARRVCQRCEPHHFLSDNRRLLIEPQPGSPGPLQIVDTKTGSVDDLIVASGDITRVDRPHASPDDRWLAFRASTAAGGSKTYVVPFVPRHPPARESWAQVDEPTVTGRPAGWSLDSRVLYLLLDTDGFRCLWGQRVDDAGRLDGKPYAVRHFHGANDSTFGSSYGNAITAEGFLLEATRSIGNVWLLAAPGRR